VPCEKQKRKANLDTAVPVYMYRKYPASFSNSPINFIKLPVVLSRLQQLYSTNRYRYFGDDFKQVG